MPTRKPAVAITVLNDQTDGRTNECDGGGDDDNDDLYQIQFAAKGLSVMNLQKIAFNSKLIRSHDSFPVIGVIGVKIPLNSGLAGSMDAR